MNPNSLSQMYDDIKNDTSPEVPETVKLVGNGPTTLILRDKAINHAKHLKDKCRKHILLDIYCKILPLDKDYIDDNHGQMKSDIDSMLAAKGMTATQYLTSAFESTDAPFVEYILRSTEMIGRSYLEECENIIKEAQEKGIEVPAEPREPEVEDEDINNSLVDIKKDTEYETFIDKLKSKTINKIVSDISNIIADKKKENDMSFSVESAVAVSMDYLQKQNWGAELTESQNEQIIGMAIREATLREFDLVFNQPINFNEFSTMIRTGKGIVINEAAVNIFNDTVAKSQEPAE